MRTARLLFLLALAVGCDPPPKVTVRYSDGRPVAGAKVAVEGAAFGTTDEAGVLDLEGALSERDREERLIFKIVTVDKSEDSCSFSHFEERLNLELDHEITVPRAVAGLTALEVHPKSVRLSWDAADEAAFREYRVYWSRSRSFDEESGMLDIVEGDRTKTEAVLSKALEVSATDSWKTRQAFFRVFVHASDTTVAGSCTLAVQPPFWEGVGTTVRHHLVAERSLEGPAAADGIAYDGSKLWVVYVKVPGNANEGRPNALGLAQLDPATGQVLGEVLFQDPAFPRGLAWDGQALWFAAELADTAQLWRYDPAAGELVTRSSLEYGTRSLAWNGQHLLLNKYWPQTLKVDRVTGAVVGEVPNPFDTFGGNLNEGIAYRPGELWLVNRATTDVAIVDDAGTHIGLAAGGPGVLDELPQVTFVDDRLVCASGTKITFYRIDP